MLLLSLIAAPSHTTAYSTVTQSRSYLPDVVGALTWIAPYAPHHSSFVPVYASATVTPSSLNTGTQCEQHNIDYVFFLRCPSCSLEPLTGHLVYLSILMSDNTFVILFSHKDKFDKEANWWIHCLTSNYLSRWYTYTIHSVIDHQRNVEKDLFLRQAEIEQHAVTLSQYHGR